jgi:C1A family cysteine protease
MTSLKTGTKGKQMKKKQRFRFACSVLMLAVFMLCAANASDAGTGDADNQDGIDLRDVIMAIQVCAGTDTPGISLEADADGDGKIGLTDAVFALQAVSGIFVLPYNPGDMGIPDDYEANLISMIDNFPDMADYETFIAQLPETFDWRDKGVVTRAKDERHPVSPADDQGRCGSCWAFAAVGAFESKILIAGGAEYDLSEQQQVSCNTEQYGCCGGYLNAALFWRDRGPVQESCTDYGDFGTISCSCPQYCSRVSCSNMDGCPQLSYRTDKWYSVETAYSSEIKISLKQEGPAPFRFDVYKDFFDFWNKTSYGAVYKHSGGSRSGGHAVLLIGWDDGKQAWLCKNSWGEKGGPNGDGTFWIAYSGHADDLRFAMENFTIKNTAAPTTTTSTTVSTTTSTTSTTLKPTTTTMPTMPTTTTTSTSTTTTTTIPTGGTLIWDSGKWDQTNWN